MSRWEAEEVLRDVRHGRLSDYEAERKLNDLYPDGYRVEDTVRSVVRDAASGWRDPYDGARRVESEWEDEEGRRRRRRRRQEEEERRDEEARQEQRRADEERRYQECLEEEAWRAAEQEVEREEAE